MAPKKLLYIQTLILAGGVFFSWSALAGQFRIFYDLYGTFFRFRDCAIPNPMVTPCFYGSLAFLAAFIWSFILISSFSLNSQKYLRNFLLFGVFFALSVLGYESLEYYKFLGLGAPQISCAPGVHPLKTPCFYGMLFFAASYAVSFVAYKYAKAEETKKDPDAG